MANNDTAINCLLGAGLVLFLYLVITQLCRPEGLSLGRMAGPRGGNLVVPHEQPLVPHEVNMQAAAAIRNGFNINNHALSGLAMPGTLFQTNMPQIPNTAIYNVAEKLDRAFFHGHNNEAGRLENSIAYGDAAQKNAYDAANQPKYIADFMA